MKYETIDQIYAGNDRARARKAYSDFLSLWPDADRNIPILQEAEKEYEKIR